MSKQEQGIRDLIVQSASFTTVVRLLCLLSLVQGGFKQKTLDDLQHEVLQTYGYGHLSLFVHLKSLGLLTINNKALSSKSPFAVARKPLRLIVDDVDERAPEDIAYVYSGYAPMSIRLLQGALARNGAFLGWQSIQDTLKVLPGPMVDRTQEVADEGESQLTEQSKSHRESVTLLCFLGGCTYTEISAVRWMNQQNRGMHLVPFTLRIYEARLKQGYVRRRPQDHGPHYRHCERIEYSAELRTKQYITGHGARSRLLLLAHSLNYGMGQDASRSKEQGAVMTQTWDFKRKSLHQRERAILKRADGHESNVRA